MQPRRSSRRSSLVGWTTATHCCSASPTDFFDACSRCTTLLPTWSQVPVGVTTSHQSWGRCIACQSVSACCSRLRGWCINHLLEHLLRTWLTTAVSCRTLVVGDCGLTQMTFESCSCQERITNWVIGVSRPLVPDYGTFFHLHYGGRDLPLTLWLWKPICLATEALKRLFWVYGRYINKFIYLSIYLFRQSILCAGLCSHRCVCAVFILNFIFEVAMIACVCFSCNQILVLIWSWCLTMCFCTCDIAQVAQL